MTGQSFEARSRQHEIWGFPKIRGTFLGVTIIRISMLGSTLGSPFIGKLLNSGMLEQETH